MNFVFKCVLFILFMVILFVYIYSRNPLLLDKSIKYNLNDDGFCIYKQLINKKEIKKIKKMVEENNLNQIKHEIIHNDKISYKLLNKLDHGYGFQDYIFIIKKSSIHTCHRDANGMFFNPEQEHKSYTLLVFLEEMEDSLGVIPASHEHLYEYSINFSNNVKTFSCNPGDAILFDANLIHVGGINEKDNNIRLQFKLCHYDDINELSYYNHYNKILNEDNAYPKWIRVLQKNISCMIPGISDLTQNHIQYESQNTSNSTSLLSNLFAQFVYGNKNFYNLSTI